MSEVEDSIKRQEWALKQYDTVMRYLAYEGQVYWVRSQHFLVAHAVLFAFLASKFPVDVTKAGWFDFILITLVCGAGIAMSCLWHRALSAGDFWTARWKRVLVEELEPQAFGKIDLLRNVPVVKTNSAKLVARGAANLFSILWAALSLFLIGAIVAKCKTWCVVGFLSWLCVLYSSMP